MASSMPSLRAQCTQPSEVDAWFEKLKSLYEEYNFLPENVWNCDESGFALNQGKVKVLSRRGACNPKILGGSNEKTSYTVLACCSASGEYIPINILYKAKSLYNRWCHGGPPSCTYDFSDSGWMEMKQFQRWFKKVFVPRMNKQEGQKLLVMDGHASHVSSDTIELARANKIVLLLLLPHTSHFSQPLDVVVFAPVKKGWKSELLEYFRSSGTKAISKENFPG